MGPDQGCRRQRSALAQSDRALEVQPKGLRTSRLDRGPGRRSPITNRAQKAIDRQACSALMEWKSASVQQQNPVRFNPFNRWSDRAMEGLRSGACSTCDWAPIAKYPGPGSSLVGPRESRSPVDPIARARVPQQSADGSGIGQSEVP